MKEFKFLLTSLGVQGFMAFILFVKLKEGASPEFGIAIICLSVYMTYTLIRIVRLYSIYKLDKRNGAVRQELELIEVIRIHSYTGSRGGGRIGQTTYRFRNRNNGKYIRLHEFGDNRKVKKGYIYIVTYYKYSETLLHMNIKDREKVSQIK